jgi:hypothetical protein
MGIRNTSATPPDLPGRTVKPRDDWFFLNRRRPPLDDRVDRTRLPVPEVTWFPDTAPGDPTE